MSAKPVFLTPEGLSKLEAELQQLRLTRRGEVAEQIKLAIEVGGVINNAEYDDAKNEQGRVEGRIRTLENILRNVQLIAKDAAPPSFVKVGATVHMIDRDGREEQYTIVGSTEADPRRGKISNESPVGRALLGRRLGDDVHVLAPAGVQTYTVVAIE
ncbi:MAG: transcription elongation factor GreA [Chloroflexi bacterium]|nr:transcription elongation factor GreA [Chloroflexota bacterium]